MPQYQNEYEGIGNALMNIGSMYYSQEEKKQEEERLRKEKEDERKYLATQAEVEWNRKAPLAALKEKLVEAQTAAAEAQKMKATVQTFAPKTQLLGNIARTTMPNIGPDGTVSYESTDETVAPLNPYQPRERSPFTRVGNDLIDTRTMQPVYKGESTAKAAKPLYTPAQLISAETAYNNMLVKQAAEIMPQKREAMQVGIDKQAEVVKRISDYINTPLTKQESAGESKATSAGVKMTAGGTPAEKAAFAKWTAAYEEAIALGATKEEAEILANEAAGE